MSNSKKAFILGKKSAIIYDYISYYFFGLRVVHRKALSFVILRAGQTFLDVGCGTGKFLRDVYQRFGDSINYLGIDPSVSAIQVAKSKSSGHIQCKVAYGMELPFKDQFVDFVVSTLAFHHMNNIEKERAINEIKRVLKPSGFLLISDLGMQPTSIWGKIIAFINNKHAYTKGNIDFIKQLLDKAGFKIIKTGQNFDSIEHILAKKI
jgi:ubiquinone/menaquinone biosynthesis C-methylase UbiE